MNFCRNKDPGDDSAHRQEIRELFNKFDKDQNGKLTVKELHNMILSSHVTPATDVEKIRKQTKMIKRIMKRGDVNKDQQLDFDEFYMLTQRDNWNKMEDLLVKYCEILVPPRKTDWNKNLREAGLQSQFSNESTITVETIIGDYENQYKIWPLPLMMLIFSFIEIIFYISDSCLNKDPKNGFFANLFMYKPNQSAEVWRFVTYMFVHLNFKHLVANLTYQIAFGIFLEIVHHWWRVALVYLAGVLAGSLGTSIATPKVYLAGASGGVYSLITAHIATIIMNWKEMSHPLCQLLVLLSLILYDISDSIYNVLTVPNYAIGLWSHLFGGIAGILVGIGVLRNLRVRPWERKLWWIAISIYVILMIAGICSHITNPDNFRIVQ